VPNQSRTCTFCEITDGQQSVDESFLHIFHDCQHVRRWHSEFVRKYLPELDNPDIRSLKKMWFFGILPTLDEAELFPAVAILCFQFCIWEAKLGKKIPSFRTLEISFSEQIESFLRLNKDARESATKTNISLCRLFGYGYRPPADPREAHRDLLAGPPDGPPAVNQAGRQERAAPAAVPAPVPGWIPPPPRARADRRPP
jgi:hypothetical protein